MVKVVEGGQFAATRARFSPGVRTGWHVVAAEATDTPRPIALATAKTSKICFMSPSSTNVPPLLETVHHSSTRQRRGPPRDLTATITNRLPSPGCIQEVQQPLRILAMLARFDMRVTLQLPDVCTGISRSQDFGL